MKRTPTLLTLPMLAISCVALRGVSSAAPGEQPFRLKGPFAHPVAVPAKVLQMLQRDYGVAPMLADARKKGNKRSLATWFTATAIDLNRDKQPDLLVKAKSSSLIQGGAGPFWFYRGTPQGYRLALRVNTVGLRIFPSMTGGYRDIRTETINPDRTIYTTQYQWKGRSYAPASQ